MGVRSCSSTRLFLVVGHDVFESSLDSGQILDFSTEVINSTLCGQVIGLGAGVEGYPPVFT